MIYFITDDDDDTYIIISKHVFRLTYEKLQIFGINKVPNLNGLPKEAKLFVFRFQYSRLQCQRMFCKHLSKNWSTVRSNYSIQIKVKFTMDRGRKFHKNTHGYIKCIDFLFFSKFLHMSYYLVVVKSFLKLFVVLCTPFMK